MRKLPLLAIVGPTAVGKTALSVAVAKRLGGEVISGDSMQVYRGLDIGTAKITPTEMEGVPHHLIDIKGFHEDFSVAEFQQLVDRTVADIHGRGKLPILAGGTGLYVRAVLKAYTFGEEGKGGSLRAELAAEADRLGPEAMHRRLAAVDPSSAARLHPNDRRRVIRALEVYLQTGRPISETQQAAEGEDRYDHLLIGLTTDRERLYERINRRVDLMLQTGWVDEARGLLAAGLRPHHTAWQAIGYRELILYLRGHLTYGEAVDLIKRNTRRFAKRQLSWFQRETDIHWLTVGEATSSGALVEEVVRLAAGKWSHRGETFPIDGRLGGD